MFTEGRKSSQLSQTLPNRGEQERHLRTPHGEFSKELKRNLTWALRRRWERQNSFPVHPGKVGGGLAEPHLDLMVHEKGQGRIWAGYTILQIYPMPVKLHSRESFFFFYWCASKG